MKDSKAKKIALLKQVAAGTISPAIAKEELKALRPVYRCFFMQIDEDGSFTGPNEAFPEEDPVYRELNGGTSRIFRDHAEIDRFVKLKEKTHEVKPIVMMFPPDFKLTEYDKAHL